MLDRDKLRTLAAAHSSDGLFLSAFVSTSRLDDWRQTAPTFLNSEFNRLVKERGLSKEHKRLLQDDLERVLEVLAYDVTSSTEGLSVFADSSGEVFERMELPFRMINRLVAEPSPYVRPLVHALSLLEPFVLVRVRRDDASIYLSDEWRLTREDDFLGPYLKSSDRETGDVPVKEYYAAARQETLVEQHYKEVAAALDRLLGKSGVRRVVLCGLHDILSNFRRALSPRAAERVVAEIPWDAAASVSQLLASARAAIDAARQIEMENLARRIAEGLGSNGRGVTGFDATMAALQRGQLRALLVDRNYRPPGWRCLSCGYAYLTRPESCPVCGGEVVPVSDAVGELVRHAILQSTFVDVAENVPSLEAFGGVGGMLRYS